MLILLKIFVYSNCYVYKVAYRSPCGNTVTTKINGKPYKQGSKVASSIGVGYYLEECRTLRGHAKPDRVLIVQL